MTIEETTERLDGILRELERMDAKAGTFFFTTMDSSVGLDESKSFDEPSDVASYLCGKSLTHGIFTVCLLKSGNVSTILFPLANYAIPEIDYGVIERFVKMK